jgi:hypothetical protein
MTSQCAFEGSPTQVNVVERRGKFGAGSERPAARTSRASRRACGQDPVAASSSTRCIQSIGLAITEHDGDRIGQSLTGLVDD